MSDSCLNALFPDSALTPPFTATPSRLSFIPISTPHHLTLTPSPALTLTRIYLLSMSFTCTNTKEPDSSCSEKKKIIIEETTLPVQGNLPMSFLKGHPPAPSVTITRGTPV